jgi:hypothetical protein
MRRKALIAAGLIVAVAASAIWITARVAETCPDVGSAANLDVSVTSRDSWRSAELSIGSRHYIVSPSVNADFGVGIRPIPVPLPESHHVGVNVTIQSEDEATVRAWHSSCIRATYRGDSVSRPARAAPDILTSGDGSFHYRFDGAGSYPEWPPQEMVDLEITAVVDGSPFVIRIASVPIIPMG